MAWEILLAAVVAFVGLWMLTWLRLPKPDSNALGDPSANRESSRSVASDANEEVLSLVASLGRRGRSGPRRQRLSDIRKAIDEFAGPGRQHPDELGVRVHEVDVDGVPAEWVLSPDSDPNRRLLYLHGGGFFVGSPLSHRPLTADFAKRMGLSVLVIDYRLMPEHRRRDGIEDCQKAYRWILENGPEAQGAPGQVFIAGDSAGGNLTLMMTAWIRDQQLRQVDAAVALSPVTDSTFVSPSFVHNVDTDPMLGPGLGALTKIPKSLMYVATSLALRMSPRDSLISPVLGELSNLPPTLVQASESEMLFDDARRYVYEARRRGSPVQLQTWPEMVHVWQIFYHLLPEANEALERISEFLRDGRSR